MDKEIWEQIYIRSLKKQNSEKTLRTCETNINVRSFNKYNNWILVIVQFWPIKRISYVGILNIFYSQHFLNTIAVNSWQIRYVCQLFSSDTNESSEFNTFNYKTVIIKHIEFLKATPIPKRFIIFVRDFTRSIDFISRFKHALLTCMHFVLLDYEK